MFEPLSASLREIAQNLQNKKISATEITTQCLSRIEKVEPKIAALLSIDSEGALARAAALDAKGPDPNKLLWGVPVTVKDVIVTKGIPTTAGSAMLKNFIPPYDAFVVEKLKEHGAVILGKNNMDEFAMGSTTENSAFGPTKNPWDITKVPGGSSGGSAASVASCECFASLGSDTGGSIRQPASFCGCVGVKPTYGRVSRYGVIAYGSSLDQVGPMARSVGDCARVLSVIAGHDTRDLTSAPYDTCDYEAACEKDIRGLTLGIPKEFYGEGLADDVRSVCEKTHALLEKAGARFVEVSVPHTKAAIATYYIIAMAEASSNLARFDGVRYGFRAKDSSELLDMYCASRTQGFGQEVKRRIMLGAFVLSSGYYDAYYCKAAQVRRIIRDEYVEALKKCDALLAPVSPTTAWAIGSHADDPLQMYLMDAYTLSLNLAGLPGLSLPVGMSEKTHMPVGMQLLGRSFCEDSLLAIGAWIERIVPPIGIPTL